ncbi:DUF4447 family protein [Castellaniella ginsengisoli]|uniref:DUF4447 family protein n=1 Tax=Castellaniella ginsengisoli TaxID=546114 RepID=A0AB39H252_9BURK
MTYSSATDSLNLECRARMNGATLKTIREALGLSVPWFANFCSVQERTVRHWESGRNTVPIAVAAAIREFEKAAAELVTQLVDQARTAIAVYGMPKGPILAVRYASDEDLNRYQPNMAGLPATFHAAAIARTRWALAQEVEIDVKMLNAPAYEAWRQSIDQPDSHELREQFAAQYE